MFQCSARKTENLGKEDRRESLGYRRIASEKVVIRMDGKRSLVRMVGGWSMARSRDTDGRERLLLAASVMSRCSETLNKRHRSMGEHFKHFMSPIQTKPLKRVVPAAEPKITKNKSSGMGIARLLVKTRGLYPFYPPCLNISWRKRRGGTQLEPGVVEYSSIAPNISQIVRHAALRRPENIMFPPVPSVPYQFLLFRSRTFPPSVMVGILGTDPTSREGERGVRLVVVLLVVGISAQHWGTGSQEGACVLTPEGHGTFEQGSFDSIIFAKGSSP
ncbi:hypothetical protein B0H13DRAFT_1870341 [Mycena leptocephala]|nr:hypothetical protein B0H13DRAFT_1870341 [Mycena leptocephala]